MKKRFLIILMFVLVLSACKKDKTNDAGGDWFQIEVKTSSNIDCKVPEIIFLDWQQEAYQIIGNSYGVYIASGLPKVLFPPGTKMYVGIQKPQTSERLVCTTMGITYPQVHITAVK